MFFIFIAWFYGRSLFGHGLFLFEWNLIELWFSELHIILLFFFFAIDRYRVCVDQNPDRHCSSRMNRRTESINKTNIFDTVKRDQPKLALELIQLNKFTKFQTKCIILLVSVFTFDAAPERRRIRRFFFLFFHLWTFFFCGEPLFIAFEMKGNKKMRKFPNHLLCWKWRAAFCIYSFVALLSGLSALSPKCCPAAAKPTSFATTQKKNTQQHSHLQIIEILFIRRRNNKLCNLQIISNWKCLARGVCYLWAKCSLMLC